MNGSSSSSASGNPLDVVVREDPPFVIVHKEPGGKVSFTGLSMELLKEVSKIAGFDYNVKLTNHNSYGYRSQHGKWEGLISEIQKGTAHIAVGAIPRASQEDGNSFVDFTNSYMNTKVNLLVKYPRDEERGVGLMFEPFKAEVWVMLCLAFIAVSLALFLIGRFSPFEWARLTKEKEYKNNRKIFELKNSFFFAASTISLQGYKEAPRSTAGRFLACIWFMFALCILLAYTASLGSILVTRSNSPRGLPFSSYEDLVDRKQVQLGAVKNGYVYSTLKASKLVDDGLLPTLFSYIDDNHEWMTDPKEGIQRVQDWKGKYAMVMESVKADYITRSRCDLVTFGESLFHLSYCFAVMKSSIVTERINMGIADLRADGFIKVLEKKYLGKGSCPLRDTSKMVSLQSASSLDMRDMTIPFLALFLGVLAAGGVLGGEIYYRKRMAGKKPAQDAKEREPLNAEAPILKAPKASPPPPPIYKVNNKLQEEKQSNKSEAFDKGNTSIEVVVINETGKGGDEKPEETQKLEKPEDTENKSEEIVKNN